MSRSIWKGPYIDGYIWKRIKKVTQTQKPVSQKVHQGVEILNPNLNKTSNMILKDKEKDGTRIEGGDKKISPRIQRRLSDKQIWSRRTIILPALIGGRYQIYNGNKWINLTINQDLIGHKFGEFAWTKKIAQYKRKSKIKGKGK